MTSGSIKSNSEKLRKTPKHSLGRGGEVIDMAYDRGKQIIDLVEAKKYEDALGLDATATIAQINEAHIELFMQFSDNPDVQRALNAAKTLLSNELEGDKGIRLYNTKFKSAALPHLLTAVNENPNNYLYENYTGATLYDLNRKEEALGFFKNALTLNGTGLDNYWVGCCLADLGRLEESIPYLTKAVEMDRQNQIYNNWLGSTLCKVRRYSECLPYLQEALRQLPDDVSNNYWYGTALRNLGRVQESIPYLRKGGATDIPTVTPTYERKREPTFYYAPSEEKKQKKPAKVSGHWM